MARTKKGKTTVRGTGAIGDFARTLTERLPANLRESAGELRRSLSGYTDRIGREIRHRASEPVARLRGLARRLEQRLGRAIRPLLERLDLPSREDVNRLRKRLNELERRLSSAGAGPTA
ncbi:MAG: hypothetical protein KatS3mg076_3064 [Candidatus Binatia bacterium]|nr:MAG: hypothetical protein KatS3mg076_3064 [Candidatus Binatia bacterium]